MTVTRRRDSPQGTRNRNGIGDCRNRAAARRGVVGELKMVAKALKLLPSETVPMTLQKLQIAANCPHKPAILCKICVRLTPMSCFSTDILPEPCLFS